MRVAIAEDSGFFRRALADAIESMGIEVTAQTETVEELAVAIEHDLPDVIILDICLPPTKTDEGMIGAEMFGRMYPRIGILVLSAYLAMPHIARILGDGRPGVGCIAKDQLHDTVMLVDALERLKRGEIVVDPEFVAHQFRRDMIDKTLTPRELDLLRAVAEGRSNQGIADKHNINVKTVESTLTSVFRKLSLDSKDSNTRVKAVLTYLSRPQSFVRLHDKST